MTQEISSLGTRRKNRGCRAPNTARPAPRTDSGLNPQTANRVLIERGETAKLEAKPAGICLRALGLPPKRDSQGYALVLSDDLRRTIHRLARDYQIEVVTPADQSCSRCAEIAAAGKESRTATI
jgi:hypothetical protein